MKLFPLDNIEKLGAALKHHRFKLVSAESCTGGGLGYYLTSISGSADWFDRGYITYSNQAKQEILGLDPNLFLKFGAVSEQVAKAMAEGALRKSNAHVSVAVTGIAGPKGGSPEKPVGTVWLAYASLDWETQLEHHLFSGDRQAIREQAIAEAISKLLAIMDNLAPSQ